MAKRTPNNHAGRKIALVGGGALLLWLLLRGKGLRLGNGAGGTGGGTGDGGGAGATIEARAELRQPCEVFIRMRGIDLDRVPADLATIVARCRASGKAYVRATGGARVSDVEDVFRALQAVGVTIDAPEDVWRSARDVVVRGP